MNEDLSFIKFAAIADEECYRVTEKSMDILFDLLEHISSGGSLDNYTKLPPEESMAVLATAWLDVRDSVLARKEYNEDIQ